MKQVLTLILGIIIGVILVFAVIKMQGANLMIKTIESRFEYEETLAKISEQVYANNWEILHTYDIAQCLNSNTDQHLNITVLSICQPEFSSLILSNETNRYIASIMPCRISIYEDDAGNVFVSRMNIGLLSGLFSGTVGEILSYVAEDDKKITSDIEPGADNV